MGQPVDIARSKLLDSHDRNLSQKQLANMMMSKQFVPTDEQIRHSPNDPSEDTPLSPSHINPTLVASMRSVFSKHAYKHTVVVVPVNNAFFDVFRTFLCTARNFTNPGLITHMVVQALDPQVQPKLYALRRTDPRYNYGIIDNDWSFMGSPKGGSDRGATFWAMMRARGVFLQNLLATGFDIIFCDSDMVTLKNFLPRLLNNTASQQADFIVSTDSRELFHVAKDPYEGQGWTPVICFGFFYMRNNHRTSSFVNSLTDVMALRKARNDQNAFNRGLRASKSDPHSRSPKSPNDTVILPAVDRAFDPDTLSVRILDQLEFTNGYIYQTAEKDWIKFEQKYRDRMVLLHGNFGGVHWENKLGDAYIRYSWDKILSKKGKKCQCGFFERFQMVES
ncbi:hypothetical protein HDU96_009407 [Phlyctochytrium bullatum]|nr:hypothetical protein HDU96_009407 [Phlyctochytrium bullatum]